MVQGQEWLGGLGEAGLEQWRFLSPWLQASWIESWPYPPRALLVSSTF